jgi:hypothetical protein
MTFVVLAIGRGIWAFFSYRTSPVAASMMSAAAAEEFGSAEAKAGKLHIFHMNNNRAGNSSPIGVIGPRSQDTIEVFSAIVEDEISCGHVERA